MKHPYPDGTPVRTKLCGIECVVLTHDFDGSFYHYKIKSKESDRSTWISASWLDVVEEEVK